MGHKHSVYDSDTHFSINPITRQVVNESSKKTTLIQYDHNSERFSFDIPRLVEGHDMMQCNQVRVHYINTDNVNQNKGLYEVTDLQISPDDDQVVVCSWLISNKATQLVGSLSFLISFCCVDNGVVVYAWHTAICQTISVSSGISATEEIAEAYPDILAQWKAELFEAGGNAVVNVNTARDEALAAINEEMTRSIEAVSASANSIVCEASGAAIAVNDSSVRPFEGLKLFGKSTQDGTPTPEAPVDIVSVEDPVVTVCGKNLIPYPFTNGSKTESGVVFTDNGDGSITANGTAEAVIGFWFIGLNEQSVVLPAGSYSICPYGVPTDTQIDVFLSDGEDRVAVAKAVNTPVVFTNSTPRYAFIRWYLPVGTVLNNATISVMLCESSFDDSYEPHKAVQTIEIPHTLPGIPVPEGGNYTDADGQQWICDEVDLDRGVYVQRVGVRTMTGSEAWAQGVTVLNGMYRYYTWVNAMRPDNSGFGLCTHLPRTPLAAEQITTECVRFGQSNCAVFFFSSSIETSEAWAEYVKSLYDAGTPIIIQFVLNTPTETALTDAEITAFKALHSNKPSTVILNDAGAHMAVSYVADTKTYIDNKVAALLSNET